MREKFFSLTALLAVSMLIGSSQIAQAKNANGSDAGETHPVRMAKAMANGINMDPCKETCYYYDYMSGKLEYESTNFYEYVKPGLVSVNKRNYKDISYSINLNKYNAKDRLSEEISGSSDVSFDDILLKKRSVFEYDKIVDDFIINQEDFLNDLTDNTLEPVWKLDDVKFNFSIERDEQGRIVSKLDNNEMHEYIKNTFYFYGSGNGPEEIKEYNKKKESGEEFLEDYLFNMEWYACDNQITNFSNIIKFINGDIKDENNRPKSFSHVHFSQKDDIDYSFHYDIEYDEKNRIVNIVKKYFGDLEQQSLKFALIREYEYTDDFGSMTTTLYEANDKNGDGAFSDDELTLQEKRTEEYNDKGLCVKSYDYYYDNGEIIDLSGSEYTYKYDDKGRVAEYLEEMKRSTDEPLYENMKIVYEYDDTATGIASVNRNSMDLKVNGSVVTFGSTDGRYMVCNADGKVVMSGSAADGWVSLESLPAGLYIVSVNGEAVKVIR